MTHEEIAEVLAKPISRELLGSSIPARLAYVGVDGGPRVISNRRPVDRPARRRVHRAEVGEGSGTAEEP